ncbi:hypothetical protein BU16DRAFT_601036 [Lophium mytilinum]|uniref:Uncharacterized protein n=1 Tax=Lophium mytilinum TaxID=390894 RepID=A0A6A6Q8S1_9PEZI|nr:hypothetical protein BU16DRAFT_601036 [Lophium mytilinum]
MAPYAFYLPEVLAQACHPYPPGVYPIFISEHAPPHPILQFRRTEYIQYQQTLRIQAWANLLSRGDTPFWPGTQSASGRRYGKASTRGKKVQPTTPPRATSVIQRPRLIPPSKHCAALPPELWIEILSKVAEAEGAVYLWQIRHVSQVFRFAVLKVLTDLHLPNIAIEFVRNRRVVARLQLKGLTGEHGDQKATFGVCADVSVVSLNWEKVVEGWEQEEVKMRSGWAEMWAHDEGGMALALNKEKGELEVGIGDLFDWFLGNEVNAHFFPNMPEKPEEQAGIRGRFAFRIFTEMELVWSRGIINWRSEDE